MVIQTAALSREPILIFFIELKQYFNALFQDRPCTG